MGYNAAVYDTGLWNVSDPCNRPSPSSPVSTAGPSETDTQPRHGVSLATVQGLSPWPALVAFTNHRKQLDGTAVSQPAHTLSRMWLVGDPPTKVFPSRTQCGAGIAPSSCENSALLSEVWVFSRTREEPDRLPGSWRQFDPTEDPYKVPGNHN